MEVKLIFVIYLIFTININYRITIYQQNILSFYVVTFQLCHQISSKNKMKKTLKHRTTHN